MYHKLKKYLLLIVVVFTASKGQSNNYFDSLLVYINDAKLEEKVNSINKIPFDLMNSNALATISFYQKIINQPSLTKELPLKALAYEKIAVAYYYNGDYDLSVKHALKAISYYEQLQNKKKIGAVYASIGYQMKRRNLPKAFEYMQKGITILKTSNDAKELSAAYNNYGVLHEMNNNIDSALYFYFEGLKIVEQIKDSIGIPYSLNNIGGAYVIKGEFEKALPYYNKAYKLRLNRNDKNGLAENNTYFGDFYFKQNKLRKAIPFYIEAITISEQINYTYLQKVNASQLAKCYQNLNQYDSALVYQKLSVQLNDSLLNVTTNQTINNLEIQFETEKKEKQIAEQNIVIAEKELEVKQRSYFIYLMLALGLFLLIVSYLIIRQIKYKQKQLIEENRLKDEISKTKVLVKLNEERLRISKDLHDNIGAQLTFIISSIDNMGYLIDEKNNQLKQKLNELNDFSKNAIKELRLTINQLNKKG